MKRSETRKLIFNIFSFTEILYQVDRTRAPPNHIILYANHSYYATASKYHEPPAV